MGLVNRSTTILSFLSVEERDSCKLKYSFYTSSLCSHRSDLQKNRSKNGPIGIPRKSEGTFCLMLSMYKTKQKILFIYLFFLGTHKVPVCGRRTWLLSNRAE